MADPVNVEVHDFWPGMPWLRHDSAEIRGVLVIRFVLLLTPDGPMPCHHGLRALLGRGRVTRSAVYGEALWGDAVSLPDAWEPAARDAGQVGVVMAAGLRLRDDSRDHVADLSMVVGEGHGGGSDSRDS